MKILNRYGVFMRSDKYPEGELTTTTMTHKGAHAVADLLRKTLDSSKVKVWTIFVKKL